MRRWLSIGIALVGCATPYQPKGLRGGYEDYAVEALPGVHYVAFEGSSNTDDAVVYRYWKQRVQEVCGGEAYEIVSFGDRRGILPIRRPKVEAFVRCGPLDPRDPLAPSVAPR